MTVKRKNAWLAVSLLGLFAASCLIGRFSLSASDLWNILRGNMPDAMKTAVFLKIRLPRNLFVVLSGASLSLAGFVYQGVFKNPLVSPDVLGVSSGASVGAIVAVLFLEANAAMMQSLAFSLGILTVLAALLLAAAMGGNRVYSMIIAGIILGAMANAAIMFLKYIADPNRQLATIDYWLMGSFHAISWRDFRYVLPIQAVAVGILFLCRYPLKVLTLGEEEAYSLGIPVKRVRMAGILCATVLVSSVVAIVGVVSWIGLIVPHLVRVLFGENYEHNFVQSMGFGAGLLLAADVLARSVSSSELPISILTSLMGAAALAVFLCRRRISVK